MASFGAGGGYCFDWQAGRCNRGASCRFSHDCDGGAGEGPPSAANGVCFDWEQGSCSRGNSCRFSHDGPGGAAEGTAGGRVRGVCFDWQKGVCYRGDSCRFSHEDPNHNKNSYTSSEVYGNGGGGGRRSNVCFDFQKGRCTRGQSCRFSHGGDAGPVGAGADVNSTYSGVCYDWQRGSCTRGDACRYSHADAGAGAGAGAGSGKSRPGFAPTVADILRDPLTAVAAKHWSKNAQEDKGRKFDAAVVEDIYRKELGGGDQDVATARAMLLEFSGYLENYLWPNFDAERAGRAHVMSIILMVNEKDRESVALWDAFKPRADQFPAFFARVLQLAKDGDMTLQERTWLTVFLIHAFQSLENEMIRPCVLRLVSLPLWKRVSPGMVALQLRKYPQLKRHWQQLQSDAKPVQDADAPRSAKRARTSKTKGQKASASGTAEAQASMEANFLPDLVRHFLDTVESIPETGEVDAALVRYCERFVEFMVDLLSQLPTRRFFRAVVVDASFAIKCRFSALVKRPEGRLFGQLLDMFEFYEGFEVDDQTGMPLTAEQVDAQQYTALQVLQRNAFKYYSEELRDFALSPVGAVRSRDALLKHLGALPTDTLLSVAKRLQLLTVTEETAPTLSRRFVLEVLLRRHAARPSQLKEINAMPLYPNEELLWDPHQVPTERLTADTVLALPKLNLQFLTFHDYLLRSFKLYRLESAYEIREDIVDAIRRLAPKPTTQYLDGGVKETTEFTGWSRMAVVANNFSITSVKKPNVGEEVPASVKGQVRYDLRRFNSAIRQEWDSLREHDVVFLVTVKFPRKPEAAVDADGDVSTDVLAGGAGDATAKTPSNEASFAEQNGIVTVRGGEVYAITDSEGNLLNDPFADRGKPTRPVGDHRVLKLRLDPAQYHEDMTRSAAGAPDVYETFNVLMRRKSKENNFKAVLETIRDVMNVAAVGKTVPGWLHDIFLGYGDAAAANYRNLPQQIRRLDFKDTFVSGEHAVACFPNSKVIVKNASGAVCEASDVQPPFRVTFAEARTSSTVRGKKRGRAADEAKASETKLVNAHLPAATANEVVTIEAYSDDYRGPYPALKPPANQVPFTPVQVEAIRSGMNPGLTMVVGPPGTGKTDVAVQIISNIYHNFPGQRTLLVTHSNSALNDLFEKIMQRDIKERHLLRLGAGEKSLDTDKDFSKWGRVNYALGRRVEVLAEVTRLAQSLGVPGDFGFTCETAEYFNLYHVVARWEAFESTLSKLGKSTPGVVADTFPFSDFFSNAPGGLERLFKREDYEADLASAHACYDYIKEMFAELSSYRAFELLRTQRGRVDYLLTKEARVIAMTCTHAALTRRHLVDLQFKYDNIIMEEAAQVLEVETFIPMLLQNFDATEGCRLKRVVLIGDHHQLPPVVKNMAFQKYGNLDQSLFARFVRLGTPTVELDQQGRARTELAKLYNWRYQQLGDLPAIKSLPAYSRANPGLSFPYQLIDVADFEGRGESCPTPHFFQNLGEAEYVVAMFMYMRLLGYPASKISILTTYNGQKHLIRDVVQQRCAPYPFFGQPGAIATVDKYQGQQNDYILLSLVRTKSVGHIRDVRRLVVAVSRARYGLYVFCRQSLFENCYELTPTFNQFLQRPTKLQLQMNERFQAPSARSAEQPGDDAVVVEDVVHMGVLVQAMVQQFQQNPAAFPAAAAAIGMDTSIPGATIAAAPVASGDDAADAAEDDDEAMGADNAAVAPEAAPAPAPAPAGASAQDEDGDADMVGAGDQADGEDTKGDSPVDVAITDLDLENDCVTITNCGSEDVPLKGWKLVSKTGDQEYAFTARASIKAGDTLTIWSGKKAKASARKGGAKHLFWTARYIWNNEGDEAGLVNADGEEVSTLKMPKLSAEAEVEEAKAGPQVVISELNLLQDTVTITNNGDEDVPLKGWKLVSKTGDQEYAFTARASIKAGDTLTIWSGKKAKASARKGGAKHLFWTARYIWNNEGDEAGLVNADGEEVSALAAKPEAEVEEAKAGPQVVISELNLLQDTVTITNNGDEDVPLKGWKLVSKTGDQEYAFTARASIKAGDTLTIWSGKKAKASARKGGAKHLFWTARYIWNNEGDEAGLVNADGEEVSALAAKPEATENEAGAGADASPAPRRTRGRSRTASAASSEAEAAASPAPAAKRTRRRSRTASAASDASSKGTPTRRSSRRKR